LSSFVGTSRDYCHWSHIHDIVYGGKCTDIFDRGMSVSAWHIGVYCPICRRDFDAVLGPLQKILEAHAATYGSTEATNKLKKVRTMAKEGE
jgi:hypothetical protein